MSIKSVAQQDVLDACPCFDDEVPKINKKVGLVM